jgi:hypothetical protein
MTPGERVQAGQAEAPALEPDHIGHGEPLESGSPETWEARQARIDAWWAEREQQYRNRPEIRQVAEQFRAEAQRQRDEENAHLQRLEALADAGISGAERAVFDAYTWQALGTDPPEPSAKDDRLASTRPSHRPGTRIARTASQARGGREQSSHRGNSHRGGGRTRRQPESPASRRARC